MRIGNLFENISLKTNHAHALDLQIQQIEIDSRKATASSLFICLPGARVDGHDFAVSAYERGCRVFLVEHLLPLPEDAYQLITDNTRAVLPYIASRFFGNPANQLQLIGITGTKGKTTTSLMVYSLFEKAGIPVGYIGSNGVRYGNITVHTANTTPESIELHRFFRDMVDYGIKVCVMEISSQALDHHRVEALSFSATAYLNLSNDHIGPSEHPNFESYKNAKRRLFHEYLSSHIVYNRDDAYSAYMIEGTKTPTSNFSLKEGDYIATNIHTEKKNGALQVHFVLQHDGNNYPCYLPFPGEFNVQNALCALALVSIWNLPLRETTRNLATTSVDGRCEIVSGFPGRTIVIDYAHNKTSMEHTLETLRNAHKGRIVVIYGSVGGRTENRRKELGEACCALADYSIITSDNPDYEDPAKIIDEIASYYTNRNFCKIVDRREAILYALDNSQEGDLLLFAGKGHEDYQLIEGKRVPFSEKEIITSYIQAKKNESLGHGKK